MTIGPRKIGALVGLAVVAGVLAIGYAVGGDTALLVGLSVVQLVLIVVILDTRVRVERSAARRYRTLKREIGRAKGEASRTSTEFAALRREIRRDRRQQWARLDRQIGEAHRETRRAIGQAHDRNRSHTRAVLGDQYRQLEALLALYHDLQPQQAFPPLRTWVASPDLLHYLFRWVLRSQPKLILELGSGVSTVVIAHALQHTGSGRLISLDHDEHYRGITATQLEQNGLTEWVDLRLAPLEPVDVGGVTHLWYAQRALPSGPLDMVFVDGPPGDTEASARYPALPLTHSLLSKRAVVILDDYDRAEEQQIVARWVELYPDFALSRVAHEKGTAILERGS